MTPPVPPPPLAHPSGAAVAGTRTARSAELEKPFGLVSSSRFFRFTPDHITSHHKIYLKLYARGLHVHDHQMMPTGTGTHFVAVT